MYEKYKTTVDLENREKNREELESKLKLPEFGLDQEMCCMKDETGRILVRGYERIVYGDHGPYLELMNWNIMWEHFHESCTLV